MEFLIAYDIKNQKRLVKVAKRLEKIGVRIEYSIFYVKMQKSEMIEFAICLSDIIDSEEDDIRIYEIIDYGVALGNAALLDEIFLVK
ncbi:CRISPR-associated endonuclease Cas2 [Nautilia sp.]